MQLPRRTLALAALFLLSVPPVRAQTDADPSGHWQGTIQAQGMAVAFEVDLAKDAKGELVGTISVPAQNLNGLPLLKVAVEGRSVNFHARADQPFNGVLSDDGASMSGDLSVSGSSVPVSMVRTGEARIEAPVKSAPISKELEGTWNGTLDADGGMRLVLKMSNHPDGTATGCIVNLDQGGLEIPVVITQKASTVTLDTSVVVSSFSGVLNPEGTELVGSFSQGALVVPLTFRRTAAESKK